METFSCARQSCGLDSSRCQTPDPRCKWPGGDALKPGGAVVNADLSVTDGPFAESKELVGGYSMVEASELAAAVELAKTCPTHNYGGQVEVRELANVGKEE